MSDYNSDLWTESFADAIAAAIEETDAQLAREQAEYEADMAEARAWVAKHGRLKPGAY